MAELFLVHSALGLHPAVHAFAEGLRSDGHTVHTPDLYDGEVFDNPIAGAAKRDAVGRAELMRRAAAEAEQLVGPVVYAGFSMGAAAAGWLAATQPNAVAAILMDGIVPVESLDGRWPANVPLQLHDAVDDPPVPADAARALETEANSAGAEIDLPLPRNKHLFSDPTSSTTNRRVRNRCMSGFRPFSTQ